MRKLKQKINEALASVIPDYLDCLYIKYYHRTAAAWHDADVFGRGFTAGCRHGFLCAGSGAVDDADW